MIKRFLKYMLMLAVIVVAMTCASITASADTYCYECDDWQPECEECYCCLECYPGCDDCNLCVQHIIPWCEDCGTHLECSDNSCEDCEVCEEHNENACILCGKCAKCNESGCNECNNVCGECLDDEDICLGCGKCSACTDWGCAECRWCEECIPRCADCDECFTCNPGCLECALCGDCYFVCVNDENCYICNPGCEDCEVCEECFVNEYACEICSECVQCIGEGCADCSAICYDCASDDMVCVDCGLCLLCIGDFECEECMLCADCVADYYACESCGLCTNCIDLFCDQCLTCEDCADICLDCESACSECSEICQDCGELCIDCAPGWCENCGVCGDCIELCYDCEEVCIDCADAWCQDCDRCDACVDICADCGEYCADCTERWCEDCGRCAACADVWCFDCGLCGECADLCIGCGEICVKCADFWCENCKQCNICAKPCTICKQSCENCCDCELFDDDGHIHSMERVKPVSPTCTEPGNILYYICTDCDKWFEDSLGEREITDEDSVILYQDHELGKLIPEVEPVHTVNKLKDGMKAHYICSNCKTYFTAQKRETTKESLVIPAPEHTYIANAYKGKDGHAAGCACGAMEAIQPHVPGPTATETTDQTCTVCGYIIQVSLNHQHDPEKVPAKDPTCTESGNKEHYVCDCGKIFQDAAGNKEITIVGAITIPPTHSYGDLIEQVPPSHGKDGATDGMLSHYHCPDCGQDFTPEKVPVSKETLTVSASDHEFTDADGDGICDGCKKAENSALEKIESNADPIKPDDPNQGSTSDSGKAEINNTSNGDDKSGIPWWLVLLLALLMTGCGVMIAVFVSKKKAEKE